MTTVKFCDELDVLLKFTNEDLQIIPSHFNTHSAVRDHIQCVGVRSVRGCYADVRCCQTAGRRYSR